MHHERNTEDVSTADGRLGQRCVIGVELTGRGQRAVLASVDGTFLESAHVVGIGHDASEAIETTFRLIETVWATPAGQQAFVVGIGVSFGGPVDVQRGVTIRSHRTLGFESFPIVGVLEDRYRKPAIVENSSRASGLGEYVRGAGRGARDMVYVHLGSGVGGALVINGILHHGVSQTSGEIGHMVVSTSLSDAPICSCGKPGHLEAYASERAVLERMRVELDENATRSELAHWLASPGITLGRIFASTQSDIHAARIVEETGRVTGIAAANLVTALNPDAVVIGGIVAETGPELISLVRTRIRQFAFDDAARRLTVSAAQLGADAGMHGALVLAADLGET